MDLGAMAFPRGTRHSPKLQRYWNLTIRFFSVILGYSLEESYSSSEMLSVFSIVPADWASVFMWLSRKSCKATKNSVSSLLIAQPSNSDSMHSDHSTPYPVPSARLHCFVSLISLTDINGSCRPLLPVSWVYRSPAL